MAEIVKARGHRFKITNEGGGYRKIYVEDAAEPGGWLFLRSVRPDQDAAHMIESGAESGPIHKWADRFSRPGAKARFKVEDRFYFGKGRKERFSVADKVDSLLAGAYRALKNGDKAAAKRMIADAEALVKSDSTVPYYIVNELKDFKKSLSFSRCGKPERFAEIDVVNQLMQLAMKEGMADRMRPEIDRVLGSGSFDKLFKSYKSALISKRIMELKRQGKSTPEAFDLVLGAGAYKNMVGELYDALRAKASSKHSRPGQPERFAENNEGWALQSVNVPDWGTHHFPSEAAARKYATDKGYNFELRLLYNGKTVAIKRWDNSWTK